MTAFNYIRDGESYSGTPLYQVETPASVNIGKIASGGKKSTVWMAWTPLTGRTMGGFRNRESAAKYLLRVSEAADEDS